MKATTYAIAALAAAALVVTPSPASAESKGGAPSIKIISQQQNQPYNLAIRGKRLLVADGGTSTLSRVRPDGSLRTIATGPQPPGEVAGVAISRSGRYTAYTSTEHPDPANPLINANGTLHIVDRNGPDREVDSAGYEDAVNPDGAVSYGAVNPTAGCPEAIERAFPGPVSYTGLKDSHPYSVTNYGKRSWIVADAGGNDLLRVNRRGRISTVAVLPAQPLVITEAISAAAGMEGKCVGVTYNFESVPTDVEVGRDGWLYVTTLAGGPESPAFGARSSVYKVNPRNGRVKLVATGLAGATNLALHNGKIYVAEFFAGRISVIKNGQPKPYLTLPGVVSVESGSGRHASLYAGTFGSDAGPGTIVKINKGTSRS